ncbi:MAG: serine/threonine-protein kinase [Polyangiaceae bacterium]|jgi:serine/threonine-protein kinase
MSSNVTFAPGQRVGSYEMLVELASGGTATVGIAVYRGAEGFERLVVLKRVHRYLTKDRDFMNMLLDEARLASSIRHPNVVPVIDVVRTEDEVSLVMDYVESVSLSQLTREAERTGKRLPIAVAARIVYDALIGLHEAHDAVDIRRQPLGIVHRDVSPQNIVVGVDGVSRVIDFGIAKARSRIASTRAGTIKGKCAYMAPEQADGLPIDRRCDVFAAGIVLWESLTGKRLFQGDDEFDVMRRVMRAPIPAPSSANPECGPDVDVVLSHALARPLEERFQTARAFARALEQAIPLAPARAVGEQVEAICGAELEYRHGRLQAILGEELDKLTTHRSLAVPLAPLVVPPVAPPSTEMAAESDIVEPPKRSLTPMLLGVTGVSLLLGAGAATVWLSRTPTATTASSATASSATATATATATASATATATAIATATATAIATASASASAPTLSLAPTPPPKPHPPPSAPPPELKSNPYSH